MVAVQSIMAGVKAQWGLSSYQSVERPVKWNTSFPTCINLLAVTGFISDVLLLDWILTIHLQNEKGYIKRHLSPNIQHVVRIGPLVSMIYIQLFNQHSTNYTWHHNEQVRNNTHFLMHRVDLPTNF